MSDPGALLPDDISVVRARRDVDGHIVDLDVLRGTSALASMVGTSLDEAIGHGMLEVLPWFDRDRFQALVDVIETGQPLIAEYDAVYGGIARRMKITVAPHDDGLIIVSRDMSLERAVADSLRQGSELFAAVTQALQDAVAVWTAVRDEHDQIVDLRYEYVNASAERLTGMSRHDLLGHGLLELFPQRRDQGVFATYCEIIESGEPRIIEIPWGTVDGLARVVEASVVRFGDGVVSAGREITGHKQVEAQLRASESRYRLLTDFASDGAVQVRHGIVEWVSPATTIHFGWEPADMIGHDVLDFLHPADAGVALEGRVQAAAGRTSERLRGRVRCKDGRWNWVDYRYRPLPGEEESAWIGLITLWNAQAEVDALEALQAAERARAELEERLVQARKLEALGQLTGGVAHDFNNLLTVIVGGSEMLRDDHPDDSGVASITALVLGAAQRGADLTRRLLAFARRQPLQPSVVDPTSVIESMSDLLRSTIGAPVEMQIASASDGWLVSIDRTQFEATLMNLCINARDAMPDGGTLAIGTSRATSEGAGEIATGEYVVIAVADTGTGMSADVVEHAFDPFFTTKESRGSGLGLATVYGFIKQSGGHVELSSTPDRGTVVTMHIPRTLDLPQRLEGPSTGRPERGSGEVLLVVEDDESVRTLAVRLLRDMGYAVIHAVDGKDALAVLRRDVVVDLLFTDVVMPGGMSGPQLASAARVLRPDLRVLYTSGYTENLDLHHGMPGAELLPKPYLRPDLAAAIRRAIDAPAPGHRPPDN